MSNETYTYDRLSPTSKGAFRLLCLQPGTDPDIEITLSEASLEQHESYEALSYTWGSAAEPPFVRCNGKPLQITKNCKVALQDLRASKPRTLWVDAICIDQSCIEERNQQVKMMREIYENATRVVISLGEADKALQWGLLSLTVFAKVLRENERMVPEDKGCQELMKYRGLDRALMHVATRPWWRRIWVVQEISAAKEAVLQCGSEEISWEDLETVSSWVLRTNVTRFPDHFGLLAGNVLCMIVFRGRKATLPSLLVAYERHEATDPRDKVFALLGLVHETARIDVDYSLPVQEVFTLAAKKCLEVTGSFDALRPWDITFYPDWRNGIYHLLPSWVRDLSFPKVPNMIETSSKFSASKGSKLVYWIDGQALKVQCKVFDRICLCGGMMSREDEVLYPTLRLWWIIVWSLKHYPTGEDVFDVFWQLFTFLQATTPLSALDEKHVETARYFFRRWLNVVGYQSHQKAAAAVHQDRKLHLFQNSIRLPIGLGICTTTRSYVGTVPPMARPGDVIAILTGATKPYVFRETGDGIYKIVGPCYIHGIMLGEFWTDDNGMSELTIT